MCVIPQLSVYKAIVDYISKWEEGSSGSSRVWRQKLSRLLESYPSLAKEEEEDDEEEDSQDLCENAPEDVDFSLSSSDGEEEEEEEGGARGVVITQRRTRSARSLAMQNKSKVSLSALKRRGSSRNVMCD